MDGCKSIILLIILPNMHNTLALIAIRGKIERGGTGCKYS